MVILYGFIQSESNVDMFDSCAHVNLFGPGLFACQDQMAINYEILINFPVDHSYFTILFFPLE